MSTVKIALSSAPTTTYIDIVGNIIYGTDYYDKRLNQYEQTTVDGVDRVYDGGPTQVHGVILIKNIAWAQGEDIKTFIRENMVFAKNEITITPPSHINLGEGDGVSITCRYDGGQDIKGILTPSAPGVWQLEFPYRYTRS
jgi:hypothetical protein